MMSERVVGNPELARRMPSAERSSTRCSDGNLYALVAVSGSYEGIEDATHGAFEEAIRREPATTNLAGWMYAVAHNRIRPGRRRRELLAALGQAPPKSRDLKDALARLDVMQTQSRLGRRDRERLVAKYYLGFTQDRIAGRLARAAWQRVCRGVAFRDALWSRESRGG